jgi:hypothetical protein
VDTGHDWKRIEIRYVLSETSEHPEPGSLPKLPQSAFNLETDR